MEDHQIEITNNAWHNSSNPADVDGQDGNQPTPRDLIVIINELNERRFSHDGTGALVGNVNATPPTFSGC